MTKFVGVLTAGGDTPGLNAALRGLGKAAIDGYGMQIIGFYEGFRGLMQNRTIRLDGSNLSGILTRGGTILGTSRDKPNNMPMGGQFLDMTDTMVENYNRHHLDVLVCIGGGGTHKSAAKLMKKGINVVTIPKTIDNDLFGTDHSIGFDTALGIATDAVDRLHSTAHSHHRIIVVEIMGHNTGWLALGAGIAGGADVILIPEIPYEAQSIAEAILDRSRGGKRFSIVAVSEGAMNRKDREEFNQISEDLAQAKKSSEKEKVEARMLAFRQNQATSTIRLAQELEQLTGLESRVTILGYVQRGGTPSAYDRLLATRLGTAAVEMINKEMYGVMVAARGEGIEPVELSSIVGKRNVVPQDHPWIRSARNVGTNLGD
ncbi:ATP-dependent 6-phosphofructokinase [Leptolinea sp. HRD-7]|nr:ATP-dependent 6-phosphofructokinase [Leptolinea sp. HRD-7]